MWHSLARAGSPGSSSEKAFNLSNELNQTARAILALQHALQDNPYSLGVVRENWPEVDEFQAMP